MLLHSELVEVCLVRFVDIKHHVYILTLMTCFTIKSIRLLSKYPYYVFHNGKHQAV